MTRWHDYSLFGPRSESMVEEGIGSVHFHANTHLLIRASNSPSRTFWIEGKSIVILYHST